jgi:outer membrane protein W
MKKTLLVLLAVAVVAFAVSSSSAQGKIKFGIGADVALPIATGFSDWFNIGIGGTAKGYYMLNDMTTLTATAGYLSFSGKEITSIAGTKFKYGSMSQIPVLVGGRYYFGPASSSFRLYGGFDVGMLFSSYKYDQPAVVVAGITIIPAQSISVSGSDFSYQPHIGFEASNFDVAVRYLGVSGFGSIAARIGYIFN